MSLIAGTVNKAHIPRTREEARSLPLLRFNLGVNQGPHLLMTSFNKNRCMDFKYFINDEDV